MGTPVFGVSPAYFLSRYGSGFGAADVCASLPEIAAMGFGAFQAEIFAVDNLNPWLNGGAEAVRRAAGENGLEVSALVGHFALSPAAPEALEKLFRIAAVLNDRQLVSIPLGPDTVESWLEPLPGLGARYGTPIALEVQPGAFVRGPAAVNGLLERYGFGFNFDTGHTFASGCDPRHYPPLLKDRILATHLCDNDGKENLSLRPGSGGIAFPELVREMALCGYAGSYDLEIFCPPEAVEREYAEGLRSLREWLSA